MDLTNIYYLYEKGEKKNQEDYIWPLADTATPESKVFIICDGVGGAENGEVASRIVAETTGNLLTGLNDNEISAKRVSQILIQAKKELISYAHAHGLSPDMATTICLLALLPGKALIAWCGDSRVYHIRNGEILFRTEDHSLVNTLVKSGEISDSEAKQHPASNIILKAIKADDTPVEADYHWIESIMNEDYFLLCTDGLLENITSDDLTHVLTREKNGNTDVLAYIQQKCKDKTRDNYSMYLVQVNTNPYPAKKSTKNKSILLLVLAVFIILFAVFYFTQLNTAQPSPSPSGTKSSEYPGVNDSDKNDSLPEFEIVSISDTAAETNIPRQEKTGKDTAAAIKIMPRKKNSNKPVQPADSNNIKPSN